MTGVLTKETSPQHELLAMDTTSDHQQCKQARKERLSKLMNKAASIEERLSRLNLTLHDPPPSEIPTSDDQNQSDKSKSQLGSSEEA